MSERDIEIVIRARDEFSAPMEKMEKGAVASAAKVRDGFAEVEHAALKTKKAVSQNGFEAVFSAAREKNASPGRGEKELNDEKGAADVSYNARLSAVREYNRLLLEERFRAGNQIAVLEASQAEYELEIERKKWDLKVAYAQLSAGMIANTLQNLYVAAGSKNRSMFEAMKAFAIAETIIQTYRAAMGSYAALAPIPVVGPALGAAAAAAAIIAGLARVEQIRKTKPGDATASIGHTGHANPPYSGGSPSAYPTPQRLVGDAERLSQTITINVYNPLAEQNWQKIVEDNIIPALKDAGDRNISVNVRNMG